MRSRIYKYILTDSGFWIGLCDVNDQYHKQSESIMDTIQDLPIILAWPVTYEVLRTKFVKSEPKIRIFQRIISKGNIHILDDQPYRDKALSETIKLAAVGKRHLSLMDMVLRHILKDRNIRIDYLVTFNVKDFIDICMERKVDIYNIN